MKFPSLMIAFASFCASVGFAQLPERAELLATPQLADEQNEPQFASFDVSTVKTRLHVISSRSSAVFGFNSPEVQLHLPHADNNLYAECDFGEVSLVDTVGNPVAFTRERGLYDHEGFFDELRFAPPEGEKRPVDFKRASGTITLRYPLQVTTAVVTPGSPPPAGLSVEIDGPFLKISDPNSALPEAASFGAVNPIRALDAKGQILKAHPFRGLQMSNGERTETRAYWGEIAELHLDLVTRWAELEIRYELPAAPKLPPSRAGSPSTPPDEIQDTPGGAVAIAVLEESVREPADGGLSESEARARLEQLGVRNIDSSTLVMSAIRGDKEKVELLLAAGVPIESQHAGMTPLLAAAMYGRPEVGLLLIAAGADVNASDETNSTPLLRAAMKCDASPLVEALIAAGADVNASAAGGGKPLMMAEALKCSENVALLKAAGAN